MSVPADRPTLPVQQTPPPAMREAAAAAAAAAGVNPNIKRLVLVTDAWDPQINGVVRTLKTTAQWLRTMGVEVHLITPQDFNTVPCPTYPSIKLAVLPGEKVRRRITELAPHALHIATEGSLGWAARNYAVELGIPFTTAYHTRFPEYVQKRILLPLRFGYAYLNWFHRFSRSIMVPTPMMKRILDEHDFPNVKLWSRGVDLSVFQMPPAKTRTPRLKPNQPGWPIFLYAGRVAVEKNIESFLELDLPGQKWVVGDGPALEGLKQQYPDARYFGFLNQTELAAVYQQANVFVFPSKTDTFGLVLLEAMATGLPVAAYPVSGPIDVVGDSGAGVLDEDLRTACLKALEIQPAAARAHAEQYSWEAATNMFRSHLAFVPPRQFAEGVRAWSAARTLTDDDASNDLVPYLPAELQALLQPPAAAASCSTSSSLLSSLPQPAAATANGTISPAPITAGDTTTTATAAGVLSLPRAHYLGTAVRGKAGPLAFYVALAQAAFWGGAEHLLLYLGKRAPGSAWAAVLIVLAAVLVTRSLVLGPQHKKQRRAVGVKKGQQQQRKHARAGAAAGAAAGAEREDEQLHLRTPPMSPSSTASVSRSPSSFSSRSGWDSP